MSVNDSKTPVSSAVGLAGVGGGCIAGAAGSAIGAVVGILICLMLPEGPPMRTGGEEAIVDHINAFGRHVMQTITFVGGGTLLGGVLGMVLGARFGVRRALGPQPTPPAFPVLPAAAEGQPIASETPTPGGRPRAWLIPLLIAAGAIALPVAAICLLRPAPAVAPAPPRTVAAPPGANADRTEASPHPVEEHVTPPSSRP